MQASAVLWGSLGNGSLRCLEGWRRKVSHGAAGGGQEVGVCKFGFWADFLLGVLQLKAASLQASSSSFNLQDTQVQGTHGQVWSTRADKRSKAWLEPVHFAPPSAWVSDLPAITESTAGNAS